MTLASAPEKPGVPWATLEVSMLIELHLLGMDAEGFLMTFIEPSPAGDGGQNDLGAAAQSSTSGRWWRR
jgi:hypothetical protein